MVPGQVWAVNLWTRLRDRRYYCHIMASNRLKRQIERLLDEAEQALTDQVRQVVRQRAREVLAFDPDNTNWTPRNVGQAGRYATHIVPPACG